MSQSEWDVYRAEIERIYVREGKPLKELRHVMHTKYGFRKTKYQYEARLKQWGIRKYRMGAEKWKYVKRQLEKRGNKCTEVYLDGVLCPPRIVQMEIGRQGYEKEIEKYYRAPSPKTPDGVIVCSPGPSTLQLSWPSNLPWSIFLDTALVNLESISGNGSPILCSIQDLKTINKGLVSGLSSLFTGDQAKLLHTIQSVSRMASALSCIIPEQYDGQNMRIAESLHGFSSGIAIAECLRVALFFMSNNFKICEPSSNRFENLFGQWNTEQIGNSDGLILSVFRISGLNNIQSLRHLLSVSGATAQAIAQRLFASAIRARDLRSIGMMLEAGMSPDTPVMVQWRPTPPLIVAAKTQDLAVGLEMGRLLLSHSTNSAMPKVLEAALFEAIKSQNMDLVTALLSKGAPVSANSLQAAVMSRVAWLFEVLLEAGGDINKRCKGRRSTGSTPLGVAVGLKDMSLTKRLLALGAEVDALQSVEFQENGKFLFLETTALGVAVNRGDDAMIRLLLASNANVNYKATGDGYLPPLVLAVAKGLKFATRQLLAAGADISIANGTRGKALIQRALDRHDLEICRMLIAHGAVVDRKLMEDYYTSTLYNKVKEGDLDTVALLLAWGARVNDTYDDVPDTVLGVAISCGYCEIIQALQHAGAINTGQMLIEIGDLKTAKYLQTVGMLQNILLRFGTPILVSAIRKETEWRVNSRGEWKDVWEDGGLVRYLLDLDVDRQYGMVRRFPFELGTSSTNGLSIVTTSPLAKAIQCVNMPIAKVLIERGAPVTDVELTQAVEEYRDGVSYDFLSLLLSRLSQRPCAVPNAFAEAVRCDRTVFLVRRFLDTGLDPRGKVVAKGGSKDIYLYRLHGTIKSPFLESVLELIADGQTLETLLQAATWTPIEKGKALTMSIYIENKHVTQTLLRSGADVNQVETWYAGALFTPLLLAIHKRDTALIRQLISAGADVHWMERGYELTILQAAVCTGDKYIVQILLDAGADVNYPASPIRGGTALQLAVKNGNIQMINMLLDVGAEVNQEASQVGGATALQFAAIKGYIGIARQLLDRGAEVNAVRSLYWGRTALEGAAEAGRLDMLQLLLNEGASIEGACRHQYIRAVRLAEDHAHYAAAQLLRDNGGWDESDARQCMDEIFDEKEKSQLKRLRGL
ncbi:ankyrin repeat-containing domain protein [Aspergillus minisclerotigenes]|uniref:Ankyrin repeat-containing domain protein n=1 Tax=Aspergillus minisclerotigenes TaxID=656917 RepID=A0A5N6JIU4_9EURO|nr:ankyrin repeat-containing domain protein [Aspergillus minisclerotigenes]